MCQRQDQGQKWEHFQTVIMSSLLASTANRVWKQTALKAHFQYFTFLPKHYIMSISIFLEKLLMLASSKHSNSQMKSRLWNCLGLVKSLNSMLIFNFLTCFSDLCGLRSDTSQVLRVTMLVCMYKTFIIYIINGDPIKNKPGYGMLSDHFQPSQKWSRQNTFIKLGTCRTLLNNAFSKAFIAFLTSCTSLETGSILNYYLSLAKHSNCCGKWLFLSNCQFQKMIEIIEGAIAASERCVGMGFQLRI